MTQIPRSSVGTAKKKVLLKKVVYNQICYISLTDCLENCSQEYSHKGMDSKEVSETAFSSCNCTTLYAPFHLFPCSVHKKFSFCGQLQEKQGTLGRESLIEGKRLFARNR